MLTRGRSNLRPSAPYAKLRAMAPIDPPTLRDGTLTLRQGRAEDVDAVTAACQDPEIPRWTAVPSPYGREDAEHWLGTVVPDAARDGTGVHLLAFEDDRLVGSFSVMELDAERGHGEIGYWVAAEARGCGIATRATRLLHDWAARELGLTTIEILPHRDNLASRRVAERCGYSPTGELRRAPRAEDPGEPAYMVYAWQA
jgi:RimJ/RimL family protein N-acetyltransferase